METRIAYLIDTNVWLERLLDQEKSEVVSKFFDLISLEHIYISDFAIHSIGVILSRVKKIDLFKLFIDDIFLNGKIKQLSLEPSDLLEVIHNIKKYNLDFDDAYQFSVAQKFDLTIITFDQDFNVKGIKKNTPDEIINNN